MRLSARGKLFLGALMLAAAVFAGFLTVKVAASDEVDDKQHLVTIHDRGEKMVVRTEASTVEEALQYAKVEIGSFDKVEPGMGDEIISSDFTVNVYRARPVLIVDGVKRAKVMTAATDVMGIAEDAELNLVPEDVAELELADSFVETGVTMELVVTRAKKVNLKFYGKETEVYTQAGTVEELFSEREITVGDDKVSVDMTETVTDGMKVEIWREGKNTITVEEEIVFTVEQTKDYDRDVGYKQVSEAGENGLKMVTYEVELKNGEEVSRVAVAEIVTKQPRTQKEVVGAKVFLPAGSHEDWMREAGINEADFGYVEFIIGHESGWGYTKSNYTGSGAYGLCQALPASKMASAGADYLTNPITQLRWCNGYAVGRYGGWAGAYEFWISHRWW